MGGREILFAEPMSTCTRPYPLLSLSLSISSFPSPPSHSPPPTPAADHHRDPRGDLTCIGLGSPTSFLSPILRADQAAFFFISGTSKLPVPKLAPLTTSKVPPVMLCVIWEIQHPWGFPNRYTLLFL